MKRRSTEPPGGAGLGSLLARLGEASDTEARVAAVQAMRAHGAEAVDPLLTALGHPDVPVACAAAEVLGEVGDVHTAGRLLDRVSALAGGWQVRLATRIMAAGWFTVLPLAILAELLRSVRWSLPETLIVVGYALGLGWAQWTLWWRPPENPSLAPLIDSLLRAVTEIAKRHEGPALRTVLPELQRIGGDRFTFGFRASRAARAAAERIAAVTEAVKDLPRPAANGAAEDRLPRAGTAPALDTERLPRPAPEK